MARNKKKRYQESSRHFPRLFPDFTEFYRVFIPLIALYWALALLDFTTSLNFFIMAFIAVIRFKRVYWVLPSFTEF